MKRCLIYFVLFCFLIPTAIIFAHQPNFVDKQLIIIDNEPDISKAYYGELSGSEVVYTIKATSSLKLYLQILSPKISGSRKDFTVSILDDKQNVIINLATSSEGWQSWYEDYGGDWYWRGPSFNQIIPDGTYKIVVSNPDNIGKYSLAVGETESFPLNKFPNIIRELYLTKINFFNEPWYGIFYGVVGKYLLLGSIILLLILIIIIWIIFHLLNKRHKNNKKYEKNRME